MNKVKTLIFLFFFTVLSASFLSCSSGNTKEEAKPGPLVVKTINGGKVVVDEETKLIWANDGKEACYLHRVGFKAASETPRKTIDYCEELNHAGNTEWRLPTAKELQDFVLKTKSQNLSLEYANNHCTTLVASGGKFVKTEKSKDAGEIKEKAFPAAGTRCVTDQIEK